MTLKRSLLLTDYSDVLHVCYVSFNLKEGYFHTYITSYFLLPRVRSHFGRGRFPGPLNNGPFLGQIGLLI